MLPRSSLIAFMQAALLSERQPVETAACGSIKTTAELWAGKAIADQGILAEYLVAHSLGEGELEALLNGRAWKPRPGSMSWVQHIEPFLLPEASPLVCSSPVVVENTWLRDTPFPALIDPIVYAQGSFLDQWPWVTPSARASLLTIFVSRWQRWLSEVFLKSLQAKVAIPPLTLRSPRENSG